MADGGDGFVGRCDVVEPRRGNRRWAEHVKARIVAESFQPGARVVDVARRHGLIPHQLSDWRRHARQGLLAVPAEIFTDLPAPQGPEPMFVPLAVVCEAEPTPVCGASVDASSDAAGMMTVELGADVVVRIAGNVPVDRAAALVRALRGAA